MNQSSNVNSSTSYNKTPQKKQHASCSELDNLLDSLECVSDSPQHQARNNSSALGRPDFGDSVNHKYPGTSNSGIFSASNPSKGGESGGSGGLPSVRAITVPSPSPSMMKQSSWDTEESPMSTTNTNAVNLPNTSAGSFFGDVRGGGLSDNTSSSANAVSDRDKLR